MNRYFNTDYGQSDFPRRSYAKLDQVEPPNIAEVGKILFAFDSFDAECPGFLRLMNEPGIDDHLKVLWQRRFSGDMSDDYKISDEYDELPIYRLEFTLDRGHSLVPKLLETEGQWLEFILDVDGDLIVDVFPGLFAEPVSASLVDIKFSNVPAQVLSRLFDMNDWPDATEEDIVSALDSNCQIQNLVMFDVGQGLATALICRCGGLVTYFDVGCGVYRNYKTRPSNISFCACFNPTIILSHWDADHWAGATVDHKLLKMTWIVPRQSISQKHIIFGNSILKAGGRILIVPNSLPVIKWKNESVVFELRRCTGADRNGSGLALIVSFRNFRLGWLLTGDASYNYIPGKFPKILEAVIVPHHGADMGPASIPPPRLGSSSKLLYSFGPNNSHGRTSVQHPTWSTMKAHHNAGWVHTSAVFPPAINHGNSQTVIGTAYHDKNSHNGGVVVGYKSRNIMSSNQYNFVCSCGALMPITQS